ncbi:hypothetical protein EVG20_g9537 [Dentipellis fragilis]|uniref:Carboxylic ester hydrolase n=1 Tax=Dentipellis fragilis TaxID=205917 RepID=A0A4Y9Y0E6_9AGAM|nr:hypothetical protein EVG20_g9537 [Dentipellis fragilis]
MTPRAAETRSGGAGRQAPAHSGRGHMTAWTPPVPPACLFRAVRTSFRVLVLNVADRYRRGCLLSAYLLGAHSSGSPLNVPASLPLITVTCIPIPALFPPSPPLPLQTYLVRHRTLKTTFTGIEHALSTSDAPVHQYRGIKYASMPVRFRQSRLFTSYRPRTDATRFGPICPQPKGRPVEEELFGFSEDEYPLQNFKQIESECLNLNITCPAGLTSESALPVMIWIHGGGARGSGSQWLYDGGALVQSSIRMGKPVVLVTFNFRLGLLGFAAGPKLLEDNALAGDEGVGNYGLRDQQRAVEWVHRFIKDFGGDPDNITLFGASSGGADVLLHLVSRANAMSPMFQRAIVQSPLIDCNVPDVSLAGSHLSRLMGTMHVSTVQELRCIDAAKLAHVHFVGRVVDDGVFFAPGGRELLFSCEVAHHSNHHHAAITNNSPTSHAALERHLADLHAIPKTLHSHHHHTPVHTHSPPFIPRQPLMIGDCGFESALHLRAASLWPPPSTHISSSTLDSRRYTTSACRRRCREHRPAFVTPTYHCPRASFSCIA